MNAMPSKLRQELSNDKYYTKCALKGFDCSGGIQWHHNLCYVRQIQERFCIIPLCVHHHEIEKRKDIKEKLNWIMVCRATDKELIHYSKAINYLQMRDRLISKYGVYHENTAQSLD